MDWDLKIPPWNLSELDRDAEPNIGSVVGLSGLGVQRNKGNCSVDLKLGRLGDFSDTSSNKWRDSKVTPMATAIGSSKRARAPNNGQAVRCSVDGCNADLSNCKDYHKRHKVCEAHAKTPKVSVNGQEQRFCQQCSRFHLLVEFDEVKRSCRKRLDGHNRRRRKPQPDPLSMNSGGFFSSHQGTRFSSSIAPQTLTNSLSERNFSGIIKSEENAVYGRHPPFFTVSYSRAYKGGKQFPFLQDNDSTLGNRASPESSSFQPLLTTTASSGSSGKVFSDGFTRVLDSECALSLLSSPASTPGISVSHMVQQTERIPVAQPLVGSIQYNGMGQYYCSQASSTVSSTGFSCSGVGDDQLGTVLGSTAMDTGVQCQGLLHAASNRSSGNAANQTLPFCWQ